MALAERAAAVRARTRLRLRDAYAVATAVHAEKRGSDVRIESFDRDVVEAYAGLRPFSWRVAAAGDATAVGARGYPGRRPLIPLPSQSGGRARLPRSEETRPGWV